MFSCLGRIGCLIVLLIGAVIAWLFRDTWQPRIFGDRGSDTVVWERLGPAQANPAESPVASLGREGGPAFVTLSGAELAASMLAYRDGSGLPEVLDSIFVAVDGDRVRVRALIPLDAIRGLDALGPLSTVLGKRESIELSGTLGVVRRGLGQYRIHAVSLADIALPQAGIPPLLDRLYRTGRPEGLAPDAIGITIPEHIGDVRVAGGTVTLYRATP